MLGGCVIAFEAVFTSACIIRANVAHVIKSTRAALAAAGTTKNAALTKKISQLGSNR